MQFRFYITDTMEGNIVGTDDEDLAIEYAESEEAFVLDAQTGEWILSDGSRKEIHAITVQGEP